MAEQKNILQASNNKEMGRRWYLQLKGGMSFIIWDSISIVSIGCEGLASAVLRFTSVLSSRFCPLVLGAPRGRVWAFPGRLGPSKANLNRMCVG